MQINSLRFYWPTWGHAGDLHQPTGSIPMWAQYERLHPYCSSLGNSAAAAQRLLARSGAARVRAYRRSEAAPERGGRRATPAREQLPCRI